VAVRKRDTSTGSCLIIGSQWTCIPIQEGTVHFHSHLRDRILLMEEDRIPDVNPWDISNRELCYLDVTRRQCGRLLEDDRSLCRPYGKRHCIKQKLEITAPSAYVLSLCEYMYACSYEKAQHLKETG
jgi:hypothetical protein